MRVATADSDRARERQDLVGHFAVRVAHDLSSPLKNIDNTCRLILQMWDDADFRDTFRRLIEREMGAVKDVLTELEWMGTPIAVKRVHVQVNREVREAIHLSQRRADTAQVTLREELAAEPLAVEGDHLAIRLVLRHLIANAIEATSRHGRVVVATERHGDRAHMRISDTGCGIPADRLETLFEDLVMTKPRGLGLGLALSKRIVEALGGTISVTSRVGVGSTFTIDLAIAPWRSYAAQVAVMGATFVDDAS